MSKNIGVVGEADAHEPTRNTNNGVEKNRLPVITKIATDSLISILGIKIREAVAKKYMLLQHRSPQ